MLLITTVGSPTVGLSAAAAAPGAWGGAFGFLAFGFFSFLSAELELAGLALGAESGRKARGDEGRAIGLARGVDDIVGELAAAHTQRKPAERTEAGPAAFSTGSKSLTMCTGQYKYVQGSVFLQPLTMCMCVFRGGK